MAGLEEFRQHLGGSLCITLIHEIGIAHEIDNMDWPQIMNAIHWLQERAQNRAKEIQPDLNRVLNKDLNNVASKLSEEYK